jgi:hypothetical protein
VAPHERLREVLRAFEPRRGARGPEDPQPLGAECIDDAGGERRLGADDRQPDRLAAGERDERRNRIDRDVDEIGIGGGAGE